MDFNDLKNKVSSSFPEAQIVEGKQYAEVTILPEKLHELALMLRKSEDTYFDYMFCLTGVDWTDSLGVIYHLTSTKHNHSIVLKTKTTDRENPVLDTVSDIWRTAEYHEREVYDLFGIKFNHHPDMRRFFLDESWVGYPFRKDYKDEENIIER